MSLKDLMDLFSEDYILKHYSYRYKHQLLGEILNAFCSGTYVSKNLWMLENIVDNLQKIEESAHKTQDIIGLICKMCECMSRNKKKTLDVPCQDTKHLLYNIPRASDPFPSLRELFTDETYAYTVFMYENMKESRDATLNMAVVKNILYDERAAKNPRSLDPYDCMFLFFLEAIELLPIEETVKRYVLHCKDIFYYRLKKRDKPLRSSLVYYSVYVLTTKNVSYRPVASHGHEYLFVEPRVDQKRSYEVERSKRVLGPSTAALFKSVNINVEPNTPAIQIKKSLE